MTLQNHSFHSRILDKEVAGRAVPREDARWIRPVFRPPPLDVNPVRPELPYLDTIQRSELLARFFRDSVVSR